MKILGIELGSTRIKSVLMNDNAQIMAQGSFEWENKLVDGLWSYSLEDVQKACRQAMPHFARITKQNLEKR